MNTTFITDPDQTQKLVREADPDQTQKLGREFKSEQMQGLGSEVDPDQTQGLRSTVDSEPTLGLASTHTLKLGQKPQRPIVMDVGNITRSLPLGRERIEILKGVSFQIMSGEFVSIVGPSGSGKSTLLGIIAGLDNPTSGQVLIDGVDITRMTEGKLAVVRNSKIGMVFQAFNLIPTLTAQENVEVPLYVGKHKGSPSARAQELLTLVGLSHRLNHRPNQLSGGEQQRVAIARALATDPPLVIADEPTGNLDAKNGENVLKLIAELQKQTGKTFIIATHDPVVASHADRAIRIVDGRVAQIDFSNGVITE
jgi:putative ABC transport system ATP-binding protein